MEKTQHTALPWHFKYALLGTSQRVKVFGPPNADGGYYHQIFDTFNSEDAAFIVHAVNNHYCLLETLKSAKRVIDQSGMVAGDFSALLAAIITKVERA